MMMENWKPVTGWEGLYEVSDRGRVWSVRSGIYLKLRTAKNGYIGGVMCNRKPKSFHVHSVMMASFVGPRPNGHDVAHLNGNRQDNHLENLIYATRKANVAHAIEHGTMTGGEGHHAARLTDEAVRSIRRLKGRVPAAFIAGITGHSRGHIYAIQNRKRWAHVDG